MTTRGEAAPHHEPGALRYEHGAVAARDAYREQGRAGRARVPRSVHASYRAPAGRDPLGIIEEQNADRVPELVPLRMARMAESPFAFFRGTAALQAADLASSPDLGFFVVACGDAHLSNFGVFAAPDRRLVFDLNDFDEAALAPWEWDVKRLVTSVVLAARANGFGDEAAHAAAVRTAEAYRRGIRSLTDRTPVERYFLRGDVDPKRHANASSRNAVRRVMKQAAKRTAERVTAKIMAHDEHGVPMIREQPPTLTHVPAALEERLESLLAEYLRSASPDVALLVSQYVATDVARRVVGVGSVGTRCYITVFAGSHGDALILQVKEAGISVLDRYGGLRERADRPIAPQVDALTGGARVVGLQRVLQASSDPFLGHLVDGGRGYYVRQFRDLNASIEVATLDLPAFDDYARACAAMLARAHAQSPRAGVIAGYLGRSGRFDAAVAEWAIAYAAQSLDDYRAFVEAIAAGRFPSLDPGD